MKTDGTVVAVGENKEGQCNVGGWTDIVAVDVGLKNTVGLKSNGTVVATGKFIRSNIKTKSLEDITGTVKSNLAAWREIVGISATSSGVYGLKVDGTVLPDRTSNKHVVALRDIYELKVDGTVSGIDWTDLAAFARISFDKIVGLKTDGTVVAKGFKDEEIMSGVRTWKLFNSIDTLEQEREAIEAERRRKEEEAEVERQRQEAEAKAKVEAARQAKIAALNTEKQSLQAELTNLKGLFSGGKRRQIEARLAQIEEELKKL